MKDACTTIFTNCRVLMHMMFLAYVGGPLIAQNFIGDMSDLSKQAMNAIDALHRHGIAHRDVTLRNMFWNEQVNRVMFIDFERSVVFGPDAPEKKREPLAAASPNASSNQKQEEKIHISEDNQVAAEDITYKVILRNRFDKSLLYSYKSAFQWEVLDTRDEIARLAVGWGQGN